MVYLPERVWDLSPSGQGSGQYLIFHDSIGDSYGLRIFCPPNQPPKIWRFKSIDEMMETIHNFNKSGCKEIFAEDFRIIWDKNGKIKVQVLIPIKTER